MSRWLVFAYGLVAYLIFLGVFLYAIGFLGNVVVPKSIDSGEPGPLSTALVINGLLLAVFALQHSVMARPAFKNWLTRFVPRPAERSTYVLASNLALILLFWQWQPIEGTVWNVTNPVGAAALYVLCGLGWLIVFVATCLISHFDLFGMRQVWFYLRGEEYRPVPFSMPGPYRLVRHPLYVGWLLAFWATPTMTIAHLVFAIGTTVYILVAIQLEERDLVAAHGESYAAYRRTVPMLVPRIFRTKSSQLQAAGANEQVRTRTSSIDRPAGQASAEAASHSTSTHGLDRWQASGTISIAGQSTSGSGKGSRQ